MTYFVNEINISVQAKLIFTDPSSRDIVVQIDTFDNNATGKLYISRVHMVVLLILLVTTISYSDTCVSTYVGGMDYASGPHNVTVPVGKTEMTFSVPIHNDTILERTESFNLSINPRLFETDRILIGNIYSALVIINDTSGKYIPLG